jgi:hypothetical protein
VALRTSCGAGLGQSFPSSHFLTMVLVVYQCTPTHSPHASSWHHNRSPFHLRCSLPFSTFQLTNKVELNRERLQGPGARPGEGVRAVQTGFLQPDLQSVVGGRDVPSAPECIFMAYRCTRTRSPHPSPWHLHLSLDRLLVMYQCTCTPSPHPSPCPGPSFPLSS